MEEHAERPNTVLTKRKQLQEQALNEPIHRFIDPSPVWREPKRKNIIIVCFKPILYSHNNVLKYYEICTNTIIETV